jgi:hypothetical protein
MPPTRIPKPSARKARAISSRVSLRPVVSPKARKTAADSTRVMSITMVIVVIAPM